jgi:hypothetical protein
MRAVCCLVLGLFVLTPSRAQAQSSPPFKINIGPGPGVGAAIIVGVVVVGIGLIALPFYLIDRGVAEGCIAESDGKKTLVGSDKKVYSLADSGPSLPVGQRVKLKGHKSGPKSARSLQVQKIIKVYGPCQP